MNQNKSQICQSGKDPKPFNVYVNGYLAYENLDLSYMTNSLASPFYADFVVDLSVSIGPSKNSIPRAIDGILNGIEVMKLNNAHKSLDGNVCANFVLKSQSISGNNTGILLTLVAAVCIVLSLFIVIRRRIIESRESVSW